ncbi:putative ribonuclease H-like domain-containing protein [Tanacetum coccineum]
MSDHDDDASDINNDNAQPQQQQNIQPQIITTVSNNNAKFPYLKKDEYEVWAMKMEYWITNNDMNIWKVSQNGNNLKRTGRDRDGRVIILLPTTADEHIAVQRESKARTTLLQSIPDDHLKTLEIDIKGYSTHSSSQYPSHSAFVGTTSTSKKMSYAESPSFSSSTTYSAPSSSKARSHSSGNVLLKCSSLSCQAEIRVNKFKKKAGRKIEFDKKEAARFNKKVVRCYKCLQKGHFARECRAKGGNEKRYSSFKIQELGKKEADTKALITVDTLENWKEHESGDDEGFAPKEYGMVAGCGAACEEGAAEVYSLITGNGTDAAAGEFALMGMTSEVRPLFHKFTKADGMKAVPPPLSGNYIPLSDTTDLDETQMTYGKKSTCSIDSISVSNDFVSCDNSNKSSEIKSNDYAFCVSSVKSSEPMTADSSSNASTSSDCNYYEDQYANDFNGVGYPQKEPILGHATRVAQINQYCLQAYFSVGTVSILAARPNQVTAGRPKLVSTGRQNQFLLVSKIGLLQFMLVEEILLQLLLVGGKVRAARTMTICYTDEFLIQTSTPFGPHVYYNQMHYDGDGWATAVKPSAGCSWKSHRNKVYMVNLHTDAGDEGIVDSGCSRSMTGNKERLDDFQPFKGGKVTFGGGEGRITGKGTIRTPKLDFENVYYVKELQQFNLFSVSQICDKKNRVLFTDTDCLVLSNDFKLPDESMVLLRVPRKHNLYTFNLNNLAPKENLACLVAKASSDEAVKWHRRMGHVNYKNMNKLVKDNLVRGLPPKLFKNDHTCVACCKGKQHKATYKAITAVSSISEPLQLLHMDLFGPTSIRSIDHKYYCLVITDDYSRFCWVFFLETKDETYPILKDFISLVENQLNKKVKAIRCDNGTEFKNAKLIELCGEKGIKRDYSNARTPQQNGVAERKNRTLIEAARTMLADSKLPTMFWTEAVSTACYVLNRVLITNPHNKTPYALLTGKTPSISHFKPFGCHVTILNTSDHLGKFDGKADEGYLVGYSASNRAYRVYNMANKRVEETMNLRFLEEKANIQGIGHEWSFDLDYLTDSLGYNRDKANQSAGTQDVSSNPAGFQDDDSDSDSDEQVILVPSYPSNNIPGAEPKDTSDAHSNGVLVDTAEDIFQQELARLKGQEQRATSDAERLGLGFAKDAEELQKRASAKTIPPGSIPVPTGSIPVPSGDTMVYPSDVSVPTGGVPVPSGSPTDSFFDFGADLNNLASTVEVSHVATKRINTIHPQSLIIGDHTSAVQTRSKVNKTTTGETAFLSYIQDQQRNSHTDFQHCLFACFLSQVEPRSVAQAFEDPSWVDAMQAEMQQFKFQNVWILVNLPEGKYAIRTKWILKNKRDARGIVVRNKARLVAQGHRQEEGIDYDEVFAPVARIEAIRLFLAFASYMGFMVYQMDVKSVFLCGKNDETYLSKAWYEPFYLFAETWLQKRTATTLMERAQKLSPRNEPDVLACSRNQVTPTTSNLEAVKNIFKANKDMNPENWWMSVSGNGGIDDLPIAEIYSGMGNLGTKSGSWDQFGSSLAIALICLSDGRKFNWSSYIFKGMTDDDPFTSTKVEDEPLGGSFHASPPRSTQAPPAGHTSGGAEDLITLTVVSSVVSTLVQKFNKATKIANYMVLEGVLMKNKDVAFSRDIQLICAEFSSVQVKTQADWMLQQSSYFNPQVPTSRVVVPTGRYVVPAGKVIIIVSPGRLSLVPTGRVLSLGRVK